MATKVKKLRPFTPISPGEILREEVEARGWTQADFAEITGKPVQTISEITNGKKSITPQTAMAFSEALGSSAEFWLNLESSYRLDILNHEKRIKNDFIERKAHLFSIAPIAELIKRKWIQCNKKKGKYTEAHIKQIENELMAFFGVTNLNKITPIPAAFRKSSSNETAKVSLHAWLAKAKTEASHVTAEAFDRNKLKTEVKKLVHYSEDKDPFAKIQESLNAAGVRCVHVTHLPKTKLDGAAFWLNNQSPVVAVTLRINRIDNFWFTLLHELAHVLFHLKTDSQPMLDEEITEPSKRTKEKEADTYAQEWLIPSSKFAQYLNERNGFFTSKSVRKFASDLGIHPAIVVGRLQHERLVPYSHMRNVLEKFY